jgi:hypothetical protein
VLEDWRRTVAPAPALTLLHAYVADAERGWFDDSAWDSIEDLLADINANVCMIGELEVDCGE